MGAGNSRIKYSGEGKDFENYLDGLKKVSEKSKWLPGLVIYVDSYEPMIVLCACARNLQDSYESDKDFMSADAYSHIFRVIHEDGSRNVIYLKQVTHKEAEIYKSIRPPPPPPILPAFNYNALKTSSAAVASRKKQKSSGETIAENMLDDGAEGANTIISAIDDAKHNSTVIPNSNDSTRSDVVNV